MLGDDENSSTEAGNGGLLDRFGASAQPIFKVDVAKYEAWLEGSGLSDEQKEALVRNLWSIIVSFVELGFGVHPLQEVCGQEAEDGAGKAKTAFDQIESETLDDQ